MKITSSMMLALTGVVCMLAFSACNKDVQTETPAGIETDANPSGALRASDRLTAIMGDVPTSTYSFRFTKSLSNVGITQTAYGADNYLVFAEPQDVICGEPIRLKYKLIPIWKRPNFVTPTCPDMTIDINKLAQVQDLISKAGEKQFVSLKGIKTTNGGGILISDVTRKSFGALQADKLDDILGNTELSRFIMLGAPDVDKGGVFTRGFYGYADLNKIFRAYKTDLSRIIKPTLKGCFDPEILKLIREKLVEVNPELYKGLNVTPLAQSTSVATLSY